MVDVLAGTSALHRRPAPASARRIHYVAQESAGDPRVGMIGGSYGGQIQYAVAMQDKRVDALIPIITWNDLSYSLAPNNTDLAHGVTYRTPGVAKREWVDLFFGARHRRRRSRALSDDPGPAPRLPELRRRGLSAAARS